MACSGMEGSRAARGSGEELWKYWAKSPILALRDAVLFCTICCRRPGVSTSVEYSRDR
jgi:hypothetical protein